MEQSQFDISVEMIAFPNFGQNTERQSLDFVRVYAQGNFAYLSRFGGTTDVNHIVLMCEET